MTDTAQGLSNQALWVQHSLRTVFEVLARPPQGLNVPASEANLLRDDLHSWEQAAVQQDAMNQRQAELADHREAWEKAWAHTEKPATSEAWGDAQTRVEQATDAWERCVQDVQEHALGRRLRWNEPSFAERSRRLAEKDQRNGFSRWWDKVSGFEVEHQARMSYDAKHQAMASAVSEAYTHLDQVKADLERDSQAWHAAQQPRRQELTSQKQAWVEQDRQWRRDASAADTAVAHAERQVRDRLAVWMGNPVFCQAILDRQGLPPEQPVPGRVSRRSWQSALPAACQPPAVPDVFLRDLDWSRLNLHAVIPVLGAVPAPACKPV